MNTALAAICVGKIVDLAFPIGWSEIGVIATALAVIVALFANRSAKKQLTNALKMQEQSKNVSLLELRTKAIDAICEGLPVSNSSMKALFNENIYAVYEALCEAKNRYQVAKSDEDTFFEAVSSESDITPSKENIKDRIQEYEMFIDRPDCPQKIKDDYVEYCGKNEEWWSITGLSDDRRMYNHAEIRDRMIKSRQDIEKYTEQLVELMEKFVASSIAPIDT